MRLRASNFFHQSRHAREKMHQQLATARRAGHTVIGDTIIIQEDLPTMSLLLVTESVAMRDAIAATIPTAFKFYGDDRHRAKILEAMLDHLRSPGAVVVADFHLVSLDFRLPDHTALLTIGDIPAPYLSMAQARASMFSSINATRPGPDLDRERGEAFKNAMTRAALESARGSRTIEKDGMVMTVSYREFEETFPTFPDEPPLMPGDPIPDYKINRDVFQRSRPIGKHPALGAGYGLTLETKAALRDELLVKIADKGLDRIQETAIVEKTILTLLAAGCTLTVSNGGDDYEIEDSTDAEAVYAVMRACDEERLIAKHPAFDRAAWVFFVYGNSGYEVINDYSDWPWFREMMKPVEAFAISLEPK